MPRRYELNLTKKRLSKESLSNIYKILFFKKVSNYRNQYFIHSNGRPQKRNSIKRQKRFKIICYLKNISYLCTPICKRWHVWSVRLSVRTQDFHSCKRGSIPLPTTKNIKNKNNGKPRFSRQALSPEREAQIA